MKPESCVSRSHIGKMSENRCKMIGDWSTHCSKTVCDWSILPAVRLQVGVKSFFSSFHRVDSSSRQSIIHRLTIDYVQGARVTDKVIVCDKLIDIAAIVMFNIVGTCSQFKVFYSD